VKIGFTPPEGFQLFVPPSAPPPASVVRPSRPAEAPPELDPALTELVRHAAEPLEEALRAPADDQSPEALRTCIRAALGRLRAIR